MANALMLPLMDLTMNTLGRLSNGVNLCFREGLTSGKTLEYVYQNRPQGKLLIGKLIDRLFLTHKGWEGVRQRKHHLERFLKDAIDRQLERGDAVTILDIASGPAAYLRSVLKQYQDAPVIAFAQDLEPRWLEEGQALALREGVTGITFRRADAFAPQGLASVRPQPSIVVASGFYDWIQDDELVKRSIDTVGRTLRSGDAFILTNQVAHPDQKTVEAIFPGFNKQKLRMKMRPPEQMLAWVKASEFRIEAQAADQFGYYLVIHAIKL